MCPLSSKFLSRCPQTKRNQTVLFCPRTQIGAALCPLSFRWLKKTHTHAHSQFMFFYAPVTLLRLCSTFSLWRASSTCNQTIKRGLNLHPVSINYPNHLLASENKDKCTQNVCWNSPIHCKTKCMTIVSMVSKLK